MLKPLCCLILSSPLVAFSGGFYEAPTPPPPRFVCFDGRTLTCTPTGFVWQAKRGCFMSRVPCEQFQANVYGYYPTGPLVVRAYNLCRKGYPFRLGEMQTH